MKRLTLTLTLAICSVAVVIAMISHGGCGRDFNRFPSGSGSLISLTSVEPDSGSNAADIDIVLRGSGFTGVPRVLIGAVEGTSVAVVTAELIQAKVPAGTPAGTLDITVITETLEQATLQAAFTVIDPTTLTVESIVPNQGLDDVAVNVTITGSNFLAGANVALGANTLETVNVVDVTKIEATVPPGLTPGVYDVIVSNSSTATARLAIGYEVLSSEILQITSIDPDYGPNDVSTSVTIYGANFEEDMTVLIGPNALQDVTRVASDILTATVPAGITPGVYTVRLINSLDEIAELENGYTVETPGDDDTTDDDTTDDDTTDDDTVDDDTTDDDTTDDDTTDDDTTPPDDDDDDDNDNDNDDNDDNDDDDNDNDDNDNDNDDNNDDNDDDDNDNDDNDDNDATV
ncbi:MAG: IPT/TIG domain-containing protein [Candidatus Lernaella stagnicola]|nr:IPT/TIG domain-containing protein [Candidatus Lernaella stagnicola]